MNFRSLAIAFAAAAMILAGCSEKKPQQYTIEQFLNTVTILGGSFSYDEERILITTDKTGILNSYYISVSGGEPVQLTDSGDDAVFSLAYFPHDDRFLFLSDREGNEIYHIYLREPDGLVTDLTPYENARALFYGFTHDEKSFLFGSNKRDKRYMDLYMMDIETLKPKMIYLNDSGYTFGWISNDMRFLALAKVYTDHNSDIFLYDREAGTQKHLTPHKGDINYSPVEFSPDSKSLYYLTDEGSEFRYLKSYDVETGETEVVEQEDWDITYSYLSWSGKYRITAINADARTEIKVFETETGEEIELPCPPEGVISALGISRSDRYMIFYVNGSRSPNNLYIYEFDTGVYRRLTNSMNPEINIDDLVDAKVIRYSSFDGEVIPAIYYEPLGVKEGMMIPAVVYVHGGPGGQARVGYSHFIQYLVNHGYAVLAVNNRGSTGYGKRFYRLDDMRHGQDDLKDCIEGKNWLIGTGYIDQDRIAILGASYGGYMALAALTFAPEEFAVGVDLFGTANWVRTLKNIPDWWEAYRESFNREIGNPDTDEEYLKSISPLFHAERIVRPLMVIQGANDPRVLKVESDEIVEAARSNGVTVEYLVFDNEGHGFLKKENRIRGYKAILDFLDEHLKK